MTEPKTGVSRRRLLAGAGAGAAAVWAAPAVTTLGGTAFAAGSCAKGRSLWKFEAASSLPGTGGSVTGLLTDGASTLNIVTGNVDYVGPGTPWPPPAYTTGKTIDLTGDGTVTTTQMDSNFSPGVPASYIVELDVYGSTLFNGTGPNNNTITIKLGGTTVIGPVNPPDGPTTLSALSGTVVSGSGLLTLTHLSPSDFQGLFLSRLEVFSANCH
jgi:hypothetical protein